MLKLIKYEVRKTLFSKLVLLVITAVLEVIYLLGVFLKHEDLLAGGILGLVLCVTVGIFYIGIESLMVFHRDLNTKQSYMLFLTPRSSYEVLGAKVLENALSIFLTGAFFAALAAVNITVSLVYIGGLKELLDFIQNVGASIQIDVNITTGQAMLTFLLVLAGWLQLLVVGDLAIVLSATVFAGKKFSGAVSFALFMLISFALGRLVNLIPEVGSYEQQMGVLIGVTLVIVALLYAVTGWIMEKKLSV